MLENLKSNAQIHRKCFLPLSTPSPSEREKLIICFYQHCHKGLCILYNLS